jgi:hypothetical protein
MKKLLSLLGFIMFCGLIMQDSCDVQPPSKVLTEQQKVQKNVDKMASEDPIPDLSHSLERKNIIKRLTIFEDENKVSYVYLISFGKVMAFYPIKGKITSGKKRLTNNQQMVSGWVYSNGATGNKSDIMNAPELDGTYGESDSYIFFWTTDNTYVQWNGEYMLCDKPLKFTTQPELVRQLDNK